MRRFFILGLRGYVPLILRLFENYHTYKPNRAYEPAVQRFKQELHHITDARGNDIELCYKALDSSRLIIFSHGNKANISTLIEQYDFFEGLGFSYLAYDYPGYGNSGGRPCEEGLYASLHACIRFAQEQLCYPLSSIILHGLSLGGAVSVEAAQHWKVKGLIVEASFTHSHDMGRKIMNGVPLYRLYPKRFDSLERIARVESPVFIIHGTQDPTVPYQHGIQLFRAISSEAYFLGIQEGTHRDLLTSGGEELKRCYKSFVVHACVQGYDRIP